MLSDYLISDVGRDPNRADMLIAALVEADPTAKFYGNLYLLEPSQAGVRLHHLYDDSRTADFSTEDVLVWLRRWRALIAARNRPEPV